MSQIALELESDSKDSVRYADGMVSSIAEN